MRPFVRMSSNRLTHISKGERTAETAVIRAITSSTIAAASPYAQRERNCEHSKENISEEGASC